MLYKKLSSLIEISKAQLSKILNDVPEPKDLVFESSIIKPLERICGVKWLKSNKVEKLFKLEDLPPNTSNNLVYLIYSNFTTFQSVVDQIRSKLTTEATNCKFHVVFIPKMLCIFENYLEELGLWGKIKLYSFQWQPIHLDKGVISLELPFVYKSVFIDQDESFLPVFSKSLFQLALVLGKPDLCIGLGAHSISILSLLDVLDENIPNSGNVENQFGALIVVDRNIDYASALLTPTTYAALLNEVYGVTCGICEHKPTESDSGEHDDKFNHVEKKEPVQITLDAAKDSVYRDIKNKYFTEVIGILNVLTKTLRSEGESSKEMALDEIKKYVETKLQATTSKKKLIVNHLSASQTIVNCLGHRFEDQHETEQFVMQNKNKSSNLEYLHQVLATENNMHLTLRLLCLISITQKVSASEFHSFYNKFLHQFGYNFILIQNNLLKAGFINEEQLESLNLTKISSSIVSKLPKFSPNDFYVNASKLKQIPGDSNKINLKAPTCCSYVFGGNYIPLVSQICSLILGNTPVNEIKSKLESLGPLLLTNFKSTVVKPRCILVYIVGGVTYSEIAACSLLEKLTDSKIVICSDRIISGSDLMKDVTSL